MHTLSDNHPLLHLPENDIKRQGRAYPSPFSQLFTWGISRYRAKIQKELFHSLFAGNAPCPGAQRGQPTVAPICKSEQVYCSDAVEEEQRRTECGNPRKIAARIHRRGKSGPQDGTYMKGIFEKISPHPFSGNRTAAICGFPRTSSHINAEAGPSSGISSITTPKHPWNRELGYGKFIGCKSKKAMKLKPGKRERERVHGGGQPQGPHKFFLAKGNSWTKQGKKGMMKPIHPDEQDILVCSKKKKWFFSFLMVQLSGHNVLGQMACCFG